MASAAQSASSTRACQPDLSHRRAHAAASQLTAELKAARGKAMLTFHPSRTSSAIESLASSRAAHLCSSTWPAHSSSQFKQMNPHATHRPTPTNSSHYNSNNDNNNNDNTNLNSAQTCSEESAMDNEMRRSYDDDRTLRACALWERYKTANTAPFRQTFSHEPNDDEFWRQVSSSYQVW